MIQQIAILSRQKIFQASFGYSAFLNSFCYHCSDSSRTLNMILVSQTVPQQVCSYSSMQSRVGVLHQSCSTNSRSNVDELEGYYCNSSVKPLVPFRCTKICKHQIALFSSLQQRSERSKYSVCEQWPMVNTRGLILSAKAIVEASPLSLQPYLRLIRLDRPIGTWLTFLPSVWSISLATPVGQIPDLKLVSLFALGAFFMRSAGCTINDIFDKDFDSQVTRTKNRPIACGEISRLKAFVFLALPLSASLGILLTLNPNTIVLGVFALLPVAIYPLMKRFTYWPQAFLGLTFNYGALMGWCAVRGILEWPVLPLYVSCIAWTLVYDTIYAFQDRKDDLLAGVKSTAVRFGDSTKLWLSGFSSVMSAGLITTGLMCHQSWPYYAGVSLMTGHLAYQIYSVNLSNTKDCASKFRSNRNIGITLWLLIMVAGVYNTSDVDSSSRDDSLTLASVTSC